ncbi:MAG: hypothetical protein AB7G10_26450 [Reyranellaceae bacterium]
MAEEVPEIRPDGLQLREWRGVQARVWTAQRVAWIAFAVLLLAGLAGLTGSGGPLADGRERIGSAEIVWPRVARWQANAQIEIALAPGASRRSIGLSHDFLVAFRIASIHPEPSRWTATGEGLRLEFEIEAGSASTLSLHMKTLRPGIVGYAVDLPDGTARLATVVLP